MRTLVLVFAASVTLAAQGAAPQVTPQDLLRGLEDPGKWLTYGGDYSGTRHSPLTQLTPDNVGQLAAQWTFQTGQLGAFQATPVVIDGVIYITGFNNNAWAIDARSGRSIWRYRRNLPDDLRNCCGPVNRGFAALGDRLFMSTLDGHLLAFDRNTGRVTWDTVVEDYKAGHALIAAPPPRGSTSESDQVSLPGSPEAGIV